MKLYFTRHGQTVWNVENKICGATDIELTELGREQARELGKKIVDENIKIDRILYSPLMRAKDTAFIISDITGIPAEVDNRLIEQNFGEFESTPRNGEAFRQAKKKFINNFKTGETMFHLAQRIYNLLDDVTRDKNNTYLLVAHNGIARVVNSYFYNMENDEYADYGIKNCQLVEYEI